MNMEEHKKRVRELREKVDDANHERAVKSTVVTVLRDKLRLAEAEEREAMLKQSRAYDKMFDAIQEAAYEKRKEANRG